jgi:hypothetical protein
VQKYIDKKKMRPGEYFVLKFGLSVIQSSSDPKEAHKKLVKVLNDSLKTFYDEYAAYLGGNLTDVYGTNDPELRLPKCAESVRKAVGQSRQPGAVKGICMLVDGYDAIPNNFLNPFREPKIALENTALERTFRSFWVMVKSLCTAGLIKKAFITGISPVSLSSLGSAFDVARNLSFHRDLAGLCGLTFSDLENALDAIYHGAESSSRFLAEMSKSYDGYHFCKDQAVETVYNTETCLAYLQCHVEQITPVIKDTKTSEGAEQFLRIVAATASVVRDFDKGLVWEPKGQFAPLGYDRFNSELTLRELVC